MNHGGKCEGQDAKNPASAGFKKMASPRRRSTNPVVKGSSEFIISNNKLRRKKA